MITYFKRTVKDMTLSKIDSFETGCWINVLNPNPEELNFLVKEYNLDIELLQEGLDENELPRTDLSEKEKYLFVKTVNREKNTLNTFLIVLSENFILTLSSEEPQSVKEIIAGKTTFITTQRIKCLVTLLTNIVDKFELATTNIVKDVQRKKNTTLKLKEEDMESLLMYEDTLNNFVTTYYYHSLLFNKIRKKIKFYEEDQEDIEDLIVESTQGMNLCQRSLKTISNIRNFYSIILSNKLNRTIKILTVFTILITIPAAISSIYGMNVFLPLQENPFAFYYVLGIIVLLLGSFMYYLKARDLL